MKLLFSTLHHSHADGQTEVTDNTLGTLFRGLVKKTQKDWDVKLANVEFAYSGSLTFATENSPFDIVYGVNPYPPLDLIPLQGELVYKDVETRLKAMIKMHEQICNRIEYVNATYKQKSDKNKRPWVFADGHLVWVHLRKDRFPSKRKNKLKSRAEGPYKVVG